MFTNHLQKFKRRKSFKPKRLIRSQSEKPKPAARQEQDAKVDGVRDDSLAGESTKMPKREEPEEVIEEPDPIDESVHKATIIFD